MTIYCADSVKWNYITDERFYLYSNFTLIIIRECKYWILKIKPRNIDYIYLNILCTPQ